MLTAPSHKCLAFHAVQLSDQLRVYLGHSQSLPISSPSFRLPNFSVIVPTRDHCASRGMLLAVCHLLPLYPLPPPKATLHMQVPPGMGLRLPCSGRGGNCSKLESLTQLSSSAPPQPRSLVRIPGTFPLAYKISLPPVFKHPLHTLASKLHISWGSVGCSLCSSEDWLGVPVGCRSKWAQLPLTWHHLPNSCVSFSGLSLRKLWGRQCMNSVLLSRGSVM